MQQCLEDRKGEENGRGEPESRHRSDHKDLVKYKITFSFKYDPEEPLKCFLFVCFFK